MGSTLKSFVEDQLLKDLLSYQVNVSGARFDWSQSYGCGKERKYLDGRLQNFSRIVVFQGDGSLLADGCMDFICNKQTCLCYWDLITTWRNGRSVREKKEPGITFHIWNQLPLNLMSRYTLQKRLARTILF